MTSIEEMANDMRRAYELEDFAAVIRIGQELHAETHRLIHAANTNDYHDLDGYADDFERALRTNNIVLALEYASLMGGVAGRIDRERHEQMFGEGFWRSYNQLNQSLIKTGVAEATFSGN